VGLVRDAGPLDAEVCAAIHVASWKAAYRGLMPDEYLDGLCVDDRLPAWREMLAAERPPRTIIVVIEDDEVVRGFATCRPTADTPTCGEVGAIYLEPDTWERGLGRQLMAAVVERHAAQVSASSPCGSIRRTAEHGPSTREPGGPMTAFSALQRCGVSRFPNAAIDLC
jgi:GNAT superfamily N-acetyltransferase